MHLKLHYSMAYGNDPKTACVVNACNATPHGAQFLVVACCANCGDDKFLPLRHNHTSKSILYGKIIHHLCSLSSPPLLLLCATWRQPDFAPSWVITNCWWYAVVNKMDTVSYAFDSHLHNAHFVHLCTNPCLHHAHDVRWYVL
jgi:hypothetical protein